MYFSSYFLMYWRRPRLLLDLYCGTQVTNICVTASTNYVQEKNRLKLAYRLTQKVSEGGRRHLYNYDWRVKCVNLVPGDLVLVKKQTFKGKHKIQDYWKSQVYIVMEQSYDKSPVLKVKPHKCDGKVRLLHHSMLLLLTQEPLQSEMGKDDEMNRDQESAMEDTEPESSEKENDGTPVPACPSTRNKGLVHQTTAYRSSYVIKLLHWNHKGARHPYGPLGY